MATFSVKYVGPAAHALGIATALADASGVELVSAERPVTVDDTTVALDVTVDGAAEDVGDAVAALRDELPPGATIEIASG